VTAATTDAWEAAKRGFARLLGRGDPKQEQLAERRLAETREQLAAAQGRQVLAPPRRTEPAVLNRTPRSYGVRSAEASAVRPSTGYPGGRQAPACRARLQPLANGSPTPSERNQTAGTDL
jgi:hypothetical protein